MPHRAVLGGHGNVTTGIRVCFSKYESIDVDLTSRAHRALLLGKSRFTRWEQALGLISPFHPHLGTSAVWLRGHCSESWRNAILFRPKIRFYRREYIFLRADESITGLFPGWARFMRSVSQASGYPIFQ